MKRILPLACIAALALVPAAQAEWKPSGPIKVMIGFKAGGGTDTQGRLIFEEIGKRKGWKTVITNVAGKGGANMMSKLKGEPADGLTIGMAVDSSVTYLPLVSKKLKYGVNDFTYIISTAPTQMGIVAKKDKGWKSIDDLIKHAKAGNKVSIASMSPRLTDGIYVLSQKYGIKLNAVAVKGGKGSMNAILAGDVDAGWGAGIQGKLVRAGTVVNLLSAENKRLVLSPNIPTMRELGMPFQFGVTFIMMAPKGMPADARKAIADAVYDVVNDKNTKAHQFISKNFGPPPLVTGDKLDAQMQANVDESKSLLKAVNKL